MSPLPSPVSPARAGVITDRLLDQLTHIAHNAPASLASEAEAEWLLASCPALLEELRRWRAFGAAHGVAAETVNVIELYPAR
jgi:predicted trehalose synthase